MSYIEEKFINLLAPKLKLFKRKGPNLWNFRCPVCGDSKKNPTKTRGFIYERKGKYAFFCQNCSVPMSLDKFIKYVDPALYTQYNFERFEEKVKKEHVEEVTKYITKPNFDHLFKKKSCWDATEKDYSLARELNKLHLVSVDSLSKSFPARKYLESRKIPLEDLYYTTDFNEYIRSQFPKEDKPLRSEPRIVIPFFGRQGELLGVQGRAIGESKLRYIAIKYPDAPKVFGWDKIDLNKPVYVTEGPFDSLFLNNAVASMDSALYNVAGTIGVDVNYVFVYDNEPRNKAIVTNMRKTIERGYKVVIWPSSVKEKDINEMVLASGSAAAIRPIIDSNTYEGIKANLMLNLWSKL